MSGSGRGRAWFQIAFVRARDLGECVVWEREIWESVWFGSEKACVRKGRGATWAKDARDLEQSEEQIVGQHLCAPRSKINDDLKRTPRSQRQ